HDHGRAGRFPFDSHLLLSQIEMTFPRSITKNHGDFDFSARCSVTMPPVHRSNWTPTKPARSNCDFSSSGEGNALTELGRYEYAEAFPEIMPPRSGSMRRK